MLSLISVYDKTNIEKVATRLGKIISSGGTAKYLKSKNIHVQEVSNFTGFPEILNGRVKTLHPKIFGGILHLPDLENQTPEEIEPITVIIVNLYPFFDKKTIENIDIGGVSLIRAAAKNYKYVTVLTNPNQYDEFLENYPHNITEEYRHRLAQEAFKLTALYDSEISNWFSGIPLKYGCNPYQKQASISSHGNMPFEILNGSPGYINILDAINSWYLVNEIKHSINMSAAASFKHVSPAGVSIAENIIDAYIQARDCDPKSSFGDFIAVNEKVPVKLAEYIKTKVCDGIIAPDFEPEALEILKSKKKGSFIILKGNPINLDNYVEERRIKDLLIRQETNNYIFTEKDLLKIVTKKKLLPENIKKDLVLANITLKYTQSNSVCYALNGQTIGIGAGQQSRIDCIKIARKKAELFLLRSHPTVKNLVFKKEVKHQQKINAIYQYLENDMSKIEYDNWVTLFEMSPPAFLENPKDYLKNIKDICLASDAFFPFRDSIDQSRWVNYVSQPGGSVADEDVIKACNENDIVMCFTNVRLFHH